jgi:hypothetical protein
MFYRIACDSVTWLWAAIEQLYNHSPLDLGLRAFSRPSSVNHRLAVQRTSLFTSPFTSRKGGKAKSEGDPSSSNQSGTVETAAANDSTVIQEGKNLGLTLLYQPKKPADAGLISSLFMG